MSWHRALGLAAVLSLAACVPHPCTEIGCGDEVWVGLPEPPASALPVTVTICADAGAGERCSTSTVQPVDPTYGGTASADAVVRVDVHREADVAVRVRVVSDAGDVLIEASGVGRLQRSQPNGSGCEPVCYQTSFTYDAATHALVAASS